MSPYHLAPMLALALVAPVAGCDSGGGQQVFTVYVIDATGANPVAAAGADAVRFTVRQAEGDAVVVTSPVNDGSFDVPIAFDPALYPTDVSVEVLDADENVLLHGAAPPFVPAETGFLFYVVVGAPGTCDVLTGQDLDAERVRAADPIFSGTFGMLLGGLEGGAPSDRVESFDLLRLAVESAGRSPDYPFDSLPAPLGAAASAVLGRTAAVLVSEDAAPFVYRFGGDPATEAITLHDGAGLESALAALPGGGAVVAGGRSVDPVDAVSWIAEDGTVSSSALALPRAGASALALDDATVLVAGGMADGGATVEVLTASGGVGLAVTGTDGLGVRSLPYLFYDAATGQALVLGGGDDLGQPRTDSLLLTGCPDACTAAPGPSWSEARLGAGYRAAEPWLIGGDGPSDRVERVRFGAGAATVELEALLTIPRSLPSVLPLGAGLSVVLAGAGSSGDRDDVEVCFPPSLDPL